MKIKKQNKLSPKKQRKALAKYYYDRGEFYGWMVEFYPNTKWIE